MSVIIGSSFIWNKEKCSKDYILSEKKIHLCLDDSKSLLISRN